MRKFYIAAGVVIAVLAVIAGWRLAGGRPANHTRQDLAPFDRAVKAFLKQRAYDMRPVRMLELSVHETQARATYRLNDAQGTYNLQVTWVFNFARQADGTWRVLDYQKR